jgi:hypothetical protein
MPSKSRPKGNPKGIPSFSPGLLALRSAFDEGGRATLGKIFERPPNSKGVVPLTRNPGTREMGTSHHPGFLKTTTWHNLFEVGGDSARLFPG